MENEDTYYCISLRNRPYVWRNYTVYTFGRGLQKDEINIIL